MNSLSRALFVFILGGLLLVLLLTGAGVFAVARSSLRGQFDEALVHRARTFAALVVVDEDGTLEFEYLGSLREQDLGVLVRVTADGRSVAQSPEWPTGVEAPPSAQEPPGGPLLWAIGLSGGDGARAVRLAGVPALDPEGPPPPGPAASRAVVVEVIGRTAPVRRAESALLGALAAGGLLAAAGTGGAVAIGVRRGLRPLRRLRGELSGIDAQRPAMPSAAETYPMELRPIIAALQGLLARLRAAMEREHRFTDAAAHELRTPLAELRTIADVADRWPDPLRLRHGVAEARVIAQEMEALLESLLATARGEAPGAAGPAEAMALLPLARSISERAADGMRRRGVTCELAGDETASWTAPRGAILAIVRNLVQNAAEHTLDGGSICITATAGGGHAGLRIENGPVALEPADLDHLEEPFWRGDTARSDRGHRGLGLAIVASLCESLGLERRVTMTGAHRLRMELSGLSGDQSSSSSSSSAGTASTMTPAEVQVQ